MHDKYNLDNMLVYRDNESIENGMDPFSGQQHDNHDDGSQVV